LVICLGAIGTASAAPPPWCGKLLSDSTISNVGGVERNPGQFRYNSDADDLVADDALKNIAEAECSPPVDAKYHAQLEAARARFSKRLHMTEADWADVPEFLTNFNGDFPATPPKLAIGDRGPFAQFLSFTALLNPKAGGGNETNEDHFDFLADEYGDRLTQAGRLGYLMDCYERMGSVPTTWALCLPEVDQLDLDKLADELRRDKSYGAVQRMFVRRAAGQLVSTTIPDRRAKLAKADPVLEKLPDIAIGARKDWLAHPPSSELVQLLGSLDDEWAKGTRKASLDCAGPTRKAFDDVVAKIPAADFKDLQWQPKPGQKDFVPYPRRLMNRAISTPQGYFAALAMVRCGAVTEQFTMLTRGLHGVLDRAPGLRGVHTAALTAAEAVGLQPLNGHIQFMSIWYHFRSLNPKKEYANVRGEIAKITPKGDVVHVEFVQKAATEDYCDDWQETNHQLGWKGDGSPQYEMKCASTKTASFTRGAKPTDLDAADAAGLAPGMYIAYTNGVLVGFNHESDHVPAIAFGVKLAK
jgi:hypothetical protein